MFTMMDIQVVVPARYRTNEKMYDQMVVEF